MVAGQSKFVCTLRFLLNENVLPEWEKKETRERVCGARFLAVRPTAFVTPNAKSGDFKALRQEV